MPKIIETEVFEYNELNDAAKLAARYWYLEAGSYDEWWDSTYDDADQIGLKIESFDLNINRHATGKIETSCPEVAEVIKTNHGEACSTWHTANNFLDVLEKLDAKYPYEDIEDRDLAYNDEREELDNEFLKELLDDYSLLLQHESEYRRSDDYLEEGIEANEYTFTKEGKRFG